jgi:hypothetical protein
MDVPTAVVDTAIRDSYVFESFDLMSSDAFVRQRVNMEMMYSFGETKTLCLIL